MVRLPFCSIFHDGACILGRPCHVDPPQSRDVHFSSLVHSPLCCFFSARITMEQSIESEKKDDDEKNDFEKRERSKRNQNKKKCLSCLSRAPPPLNHHDCRWRGKKILSLIPREWKRGGNVEESWQASVQRDWEKRGFCHGRPVHSPCWEEIKSFLAGRRRWGKQQKMKKDGHRLGRLGRWIVVSREREQDAGPEKERSIQPVPSEEEQKKEDSWNQRKDKKSKMKMKSIESIEASKRRSSVNAGLATRPPGEVERRSAHQKQCAVTESHRARLYAQLIDHRSNLTELTRPRHFLLPFYFRLLLLLLLWLDPDSRHDNQGQKNGEVSCVCVSVKVTWAKRGLLLLENELADIGGLMMNDRLAPIVPCRCHKQATSWRQWAVPTTRGYRELFYIQIIYWFFLCRPSYFWVSTPFF